MRSLIADIPALPLAIGGLVQADGSTFNLGFTSSKTGTGVYAIRTSLFAVFTDIEATLAVGGFIYVTWPSPTSGVVQVNTFASNAASADAPFMISIKGRPR
jgi:hypothetical protein